MPLQSRGDDRSPSPRISGAAWCVRRQMAGAPRGGIKRGSRVALSSLSRSLREVGAVADARGIRGCSRGRRQHRRALPERATLQAPRRRAAAQRGASLSSLGLLSPPACSPASARRRARDRLRFDCPTGPARVKQVEGDSRKLKEILVGAPIPERSRPAPGGALRCDSSCDGRRRRWSSPVWP